MQGALQSFIAILHCNPALQSCIASFQKKLTFNFLITLLTLLVRVTGHVPKAVGVFSGCSTHQYEWSAVGRIGCIMAFCG
jgi:hypothetical protein